MKVPDPIGEPLNKHILQIIKWTWMTEILNYLQKDKSRLMTC